jgi:hypothetical protein
VTAADETSVGTPTGFSPLGQVAPLAVLQAGTDVLRSAPGRLTGRMCLTVRFREHHRTARFCNRYVSSETDDTSATSNPVASSAAFDAVTALGLIDTYEGRAPHVERVDATLHLERGEVTAALRGVRMPRTVHPGQRVRLRIALQHIRGSRTTRTVRVRIPRGVRPGRRNLILMGAKGSGSELDQLLDLLVGDSGGASAAPATLDELVGAIDATGGYDGVTGRIDGESFRVFRDPHELVTGRTGTTVRVRRRR